MRNRFSKSRFDLNDRLGEIAEYGRGGRLDSHYFKPNKLLLRAKDRAESLLDKLFDRLGRGERDPWGHDDDFSGYNWGRGVFRFWRDCHGPRRRKDLSEVVARPIDGEGTNEQYKDWGATHQELVRLAPAAFADGVGDMVTDRPNAREISNAVAQQDGETPNSFGVSDMFWAWGQFIDHDMDLTEASDTESVPIIAPVGDPVFAPGTPILFSRVAPVEGSGVDTPRTYENEITAFLDGSMVYGSDAETAAALREGAYLVLDEDGLLVRTNDGVLAGDVRAAENVALTSLHTLFAREHNRWVDELRAKHPDWAADMLFDAARMRVEAQIQAITYNEWLPLLVGEGALDRYRGYDEHVNPGISVEFSTAAFRFGHSLLSADIERLEEDGAEISAGAIALRDAFFNPDAIGENGGIDPILRGLAGSTASELDNQVVEDVRSFLFSPAPGSPGLDLAAINIQRGRDLGVASYNDLREALELGRASAFTDITSDADLAATLEQVYGDVDRVDAWVGGLAEDAHGDGMLGELFATIIIDQFTRLRDGDPYWSKAKGGLSPAEARAIWDTTLADVIEANTEVGTMQAEAFMAFARIGGTDLGDDLTGTDASDLILGFGGDDSLTGDAGDDELYGGAGADRFYFAPGSGHDLIADFERADTIVLDGYRAPRRRDFERDDGDVVLQLSEDSSITFEDTNIRDLFGSFTIL